MRDLFFKSSESRAQLIAFTKWWMVFQILNGTFLVGDYPEGYAPGSLCTWWVGHVLISNSNK